MSLQKIIEFFTKSELESILDSLDTSGQDLHSGRARRETIIERIMQFEAEDILSALEYHQIQEIFTLLGKEMKLTKQDCMEERRPYRAPTKSTRMVFAGHETTLRSEHGLNRTSPYPLA